ncbi:uncharacterized protein [Porites lutea]|uniref:uncharacterized protein n=1 Tax=Porites lutea TaxID=51062 RepID=UPI003CC69900
MYVRGKQIGITFYSGKCCQERGFHLLFTALKPTPPKIILPDPDPVVRAFAGADLWISVTGTPPISITLKNDTAVLENGTKDIRHRLTNEGNYSCIAVNDYGNITSVNFSVVFIDCRPQCSMSWTLVNRNYLKCRNITSLTHVLKKCVPTITETLDLSSNNIQNLQKDDFARLKNLRQLILSSNAIGLLPESVFASLENLEELDFAHNALTTIPGRVFSNMTYLFGLYLWHNRINVLSKEAFINLSYLHLLYLSSNALTSLPEGVFASLERLAMLYLSSNALRVIPEGMFANLSNLQLLDLSLNKIRELPVTTFVNLGKLHLINISSNALPALPKDVFANLTSLFTL